MLTYHAIADGPPPLCVSAELFERHVEEIVASGAEVLTVTELADAIARGQGSSTSASR